VSARIKQTIHAERIDVVATQLPIEVSNSVDGRCRLMMKYRLKDSVPAVYHTHEGGELRVMLPARAIVTESSQCSTTPKGIVAILWEGRLYQVRRKDLLNKAERTATA